MEALDLRCDYKKHGELKDGILYVKCSSRFCKHEPGVVVIHRWDVLTGARLEDQRFRDPFPVRKKEQAA
jgi:hypothetical protein